MAVSTKGKTEARTSRSRRMIWYGTAGVALASAGASFIVVTPITAPAPQAHVADILRTSGEDPDVYIDIIRHGVPSPPPPDFTTETPGPDLCTVAPCGGDSPANETGTGQAAFTGETLYKEFGPVSGVFSGNSLRDLETGQGYVNVLQEHGVTIPASETPNLPPGTPGFPDLTQLWQLNEAYSYLYLPQLTLDTPGGLLYQLEVLLWSLGLTLLPMPGGNYVTGVALDNDFTQGIDIMYANSANGIISSDGHIHEIGFNNDAAITAWTLMNVKNPDLLYFIPAFLDQLTSEFTGQGTAQLLDYAGIVEFNGNPTEGWTLDSWNGTAIPSFPDPLTESFVLFRDLIMPPQALVYDFISALFTGNPTTILDTTVTGIQDVIQSIIATPGDLTGYITTAVTDPDLFLASFRTHPSNLPSPSGPLPNPASAVDPNSGDLLGGTNLGDLANPGSFDVGDLANLLPTTGLAGLVPAELATMISGAFTSF